MDQRAFPARVPMPGRPVDFSASDVRYERDDNPASNLDPIRF